MHQTRAELIHPLLTNAAFQSSFKLCLLSEALNKPPENIWLCKKVKGLKSIYRNCSLFSALLFSLFFYRSRNQLSFRDKIRLLKNRIRIQGSAIRLKIKIKKNKTFLHQIKFLIIIKTNFHFYLRKEKKTENIFKNWLSFQSSSLWVDLI